MSMRTVVIALNTYMTAIPARIMVVGDALFMAETTTMTAVGIRENMNAFRTSENCPLNRVIPDTIAMVAPKLAPDDIPVV